MPEAEFVGSMSVSAFTAETVTSLPPDATLLEVADALTSGDVGALALMEDDRVVGVVSERDLAGAIAKRLPIETTKAIEVASTQLVWCDSEATVSDVANEMLEHYVRHVLVEADGVLVGVVSARDLLGAYASAEDETD